MGKVAGEEVTVPLRLGRVKITFLSLKPTYLGEDERSLSRISVWLDQDLHQFDKGDKFVTLVDWCGFYEFLHNIWPYCLDGQEEIVVKELLSVRLLVVR